ncbi:MAG: hypothetical protein ABI599_02845 [Flavobacteriales bacterium]
MLNTGPVQLRLVRDFEQTIGDAFSFLKQNGKLLVKAIVYFSAVPMVIYGLLNATQLVGMGRPSTAGDPFAAVFAIYGKLAVVFIPYVVARVLVNAAVLEYVRAYLLNEHYGLTLGELWKRVAKNFWTYLGIWIVSYLLFGIGFVLCFLPGIYLMTAAVLAGIVHAVERSGFGDGFNKSFSLVNRSFWPMLGLVVVLGLIQWVLTLLLSLPTMLFTGVEQMFAPGFDGSIDLPTWKLVATGILSTVVGILEQVIHAVAVIALALRYFSLVEQREGVGLNEKLAGLDPGPN